MNDHRSLRSQLLIPFLAIGISLIAISGTVYYVFSAIGHAMRPLALQQSQLSRAQSMLWMDEILTQSLRNFIWNKDPSWKKRYDDFATQLDTISLAAKDEATDAATKAIFQQQSDANAKLVDIETRAYELVETTVCPGHR